MVVEDLAKETGQAASYRRLCLYRTATRLHPGASCPGSIAGVGQAAGGHPRGEAGRVGKAGWKMSKGCDLDEEMLSDQEDRGLGCPKNLDRGVAGATDHGWLEGVVPLAQLKPFYPSVAPFASRNVPVWRLLSPAG
jgi:hypothetical protein